MIISTILVLGLAVSFYVYYESQSDIRELIAQQKTNDVSYLWLKEGIEAGDLTSKQKKQVKARMNRMEQRFKRNAKKWASRAVTFNENSHGGGTEYENPLKNQLTFQEAEEIAWELIADYQLHPDQQTTLKAAVYADFKKSFIWGLTNYSSHHDPVYLLFFEGEFVLGNTDITVPYAVLRVNPKTGNVSASISETPKVDDYFQLRKLEVEEGSSRIYSS